MVGTHKRKLRFHGRLRFAYRALQVVLFMFSNGERRNNASKEFYRNTKE